MNNTNRDRKVTAFGRIQTIAMWAKELNINYRTLKSRFRNGWTLERALSTQTDRSKNHHTSSAPVTASLPVV